MSQKSFSKGSKTKVLSLREGRRRMVFCLLPLLALSATGARAQARNFPGVLQDPPLPIGPGVTYRAAHEPSAPWEIRILELDLANPNVTLVPGVPTAEGTRETTSAIAARAGALGAVNGGYFGGDISVSHIEIDDATLATNPSYRGARSTFGLSANHAALLVQARLDSLSQPTPPNPDWARVIHALGGGPQLLKDGAIAITDAEEELLSPSRQPRTFLGWNRATRRVWLVTVDGRQAGWSAGMTYEEEARFLLDLGADNGLNYDGGGSTTMWIRGAVVNRPSDGAERAVTSAWLVMPSNVVDDSDPEFAAEGPWTTNTATRAYAGAAREIAGARPANEAATWRPRLERPGLYEVFAWWPEALAPGEEVIVDNLDAGATVSGEWAASANAGFYGTNSLYSWGGTGADTVTWRPALGAGGVYRVDAWWVASNNRAAAAPFTISHAGGETTVYVDQRAGANRWNPLGEFTFDPAADPRVTLSDAVPAAALVSADAVRFQPVAPPETRAATYEILHSSGISYVSVNQGENGGRWNSLGAFYFQGGSGGLARLLPGGGADARVTADAMRWTLREPGASASGGGWLLR